MVDKDNQIEEMANDIWASCPTPDMNIGEATYTAEKLYNAGYRKQIEAKWIEHLHFNFEGGYSGSHYECSNCHYDDCYEETPYCPYCGAKMKGGK